MPLLTVGGFLSVLSWGAGFCISIVNLCLLIPNKGPRAARMVMAIVLAINLSPIISMAAVEIARDAGFLTYVRVKQKDGTWKRVAKRYAVPYLRD